MKDAADAMHVNAVLPRMQDLRAVTCQKLSCWTTLDLHAAIQCNYDVCTCSQLNAACI